MISARPTSMAAAPAPAPVPPRSAPRSPPACQPAQHKHMQGIVLGTKERCVAVPVAKATAEACVLPSAGAPPTSACSSASSARMPGTTCSALTSLYAGKGESCKHMGRPPGGQRRCERWEAAAPLAAAAPANFRPHPTSHWAAHRQQRVGLHHGAVRCSRAGQAGSVGGPAARSGQARLGASQRADRGDGGTESGSAGQCAHHTRSKEHSASGKGAADHGHITRSDQRPMRQCGQGGRPWGNAAARHVALGASGQSFRAWHRDRQAATLPLLSHPEPTHQAHNMNSTGLQAIRLSLTPLLRLPKSHGSVPPEDKTDVTHATLQAREPARDQDTLNRAAAGSWLALCALTSGRAA